MAKISYIEKLKNPLWQKKRLEIFQRDGFRCTSMGCFEDGKTLHVHHLDYISGREPWDYPNEYFMTLCEDCHNDITKRRPEYEKKIINQLRLKLKDGFIQKCAAELFESFTQEQLHDLIYMLWEIKDNQSEILDLVQQKIYWKIHDREVKKIKSMLKKKENTNV